jgi:hypothetical protein
VLQKQIPASPWVRMWRILARHSRWHLFRVYALHQEHSLQCERDRRQGGGRYHLYLLLLVLWQSSCRRGRRCAGHLCLSTAQSALGAVTFGGEQRSYLRIRCRAAHEFRLRRTQKCSAMVLRPPRQARQRWTNAVGRCRAGESVERAAARRRAGGVQSARRPRQPYGKPPQQQEQEQL